MTFKHFSGISILVLLSLILSTVTAPSYGQHRKKNKKENVPVLMPWEIDTLIKPIPINRQIFTDQVKDEIKKADLRDGELDNLIDLEDTAVSKLLTDVFLVKAPLILIHIENLEKADHQTKIRYHKAFLNLLRRLNHRSFNNEDLSYFRRSVSNFELMVIALEQDKLKPFIKDHTNIYTLDNSDLLNDYPKEKAFVFEMVGKDYPEMMIQRLPEFARESYADPIVASAARIVPKTILNYATSTSYLSTAVRRNQDPLVQTIVKIANDSKNPLGALPFLDDIFIKRKTIAEVDQFTSNEKEYYKELVKLKLANHNMAQRALNDEVNYRGLQFVRVVNELHESTAPIRFASLMDFNAEEIYFMLIGGQDEIYTSSYTWMFDRMMVKMAPEKGDEFLQRIHKDHFRTFLRMCAGYNKLSPFLKTMDEDKKTLLMKEFIANLEKGLSDDLEDAVDVADAFGSITDPALMDFLKKEVKSNYERVYKANNAESTKGVIIYGLLSTIFNSAENSNKLSGNLSIIPPITYVPNKSLRNDKNQIIIQAFFYGDEDGKMSFNSFKSNFNSNKWKSSGNKSWVKYTSTGPNEIIVYANLPLNEPQDETAQRELSAFFKENNLTPTVVIHRGHSYHLDGSLSTLTPDVKVVMLGSCGGYHNLAKVLDKAPDANIISSKQVGAASVNDPIISEMLSQLLKGNDLNWLDAWTDLNVYFSKRGAHERDLFSDYIPPNKNLGAIFIKAYRKLDQQTSYQ